MSGPSASKSIRYTRAGRTTRKVEVSGEGSPEGVGSFHARENAAHIAPMIPKQWCQLTRLITSSRLFRYGGEAVVSEGHHVENALIIVEREGSKNCVLASMSVLHDFCHPTFLGVLLGLESFEADLEWSWRPR